MKQRTSPWWIAGIAFLAVGVFYLYAFVLPFMRSIRDQAQIRNSNPVALLSACREMIANRDAISKNCSNAMVAANGDIYLSLAFGEYCDDVPRIIRDMRPLHIDISEHQVLVSMHGPPRTGFIGYTEGAREEEGSRNNQDTMLTNGLWIIH